MNSDIGTKTISDDLAFSDATALSSAIAAREISCVEVMRTYLDRIRRLNPVHNAIISMRDEDTLMAEAAEADADLSAGRHRGWMHGFPLAVKDLSATAGIATTFGSPVFAGNVPEQDCVMVSRLRAAGAIVIGKTNTPEFGLGSHTFNSLHGVTRNAWNPALSAGGSSGGAAVSIALGMQPVADGSDMMGSLRNPAAFNNVLGLRPTFGRVPYGPKPEVFVHQLGTNGPMARNVRDLAHLLDAQSGHDATAPFSLDAPQTAFADALDGDVTGLRIGWIGDWQGYYACEPGILDLCGRGVQQFATLGARVEPLVPDFAPEMLWDSWVTLRSWSVAGAYAAHLSNPDTRDLLKPELVWEIENGLTLTGMAVNAASVARSAWFRCLTDLFTRYDAIAMPSAQVFPFDADIAWPDRIGDRTMDSYHRWMEIVIAGSLSSCPCINLPAGFDLSGRPTGFQLIGRPRAEQQLLKLAARYEEATDWLSMRPEGALGTV
ncbi:MAG: amidase [Minwuia sp.]|nr:amidase [Minwuia sp.]